MARRATAGEDEALAAFAQQLAGIKHHFADADRQNAPALYGVAMPRPQKVISLDDWGLLLDAVKARLRQVAGQPLAREGDGALTALRTGVLECVDALDQLHLVLGHALSQRERIDDDGSRLAAQAPGSGVPVSTSPLVNCARAAVASDS